MTSSTVHAGTIHVVGAGLGGLAAAIRLAQSGRRVALYEAAGQAGGRCRSYYDTALDRRIDNGNHLLFSGNHAAMEYLRAIGAINTLDGPEYAKLHLIYQWNEFGLFGPTTWTDPSQDVRLEK